MSTGILEVDLDGLMTDVINEVCDIARLQWKDAVRSWFDRLDAPDKRKLVRLLQVRKREQAWRSTS